MAVDDITFQEKVQFVLEIPEDSNAPAEILSDIDGIIETEAVGGGDTIIINYPRKIR